MHLRALPIAIGITLSLFLLPQKQEEKTVAVERVSWLEETKCLEMFSAMTQGPDGRIYAGTCNASKIGACLITFDPKSRRQEKLADMQEVCGETNAKTLPQSKIHSQICFDSKGVAWFGTHCYDWGTLEQFEKSPSDYSGGHLVTYDTHSRKATDHGILIPHESIMSLALAERVGKVYCVLHPTGRFVVYDIRTGTVSDKGRILDYPYHRSQRRSRLHVHALRRCGAVRSGDGSPRKTPRARAALSRRDRYAREPSVRPCGKRRPDKNLRGGLVQRPAV